MCINKLPQKKGVKGGGGKEEYIPSQSNIKVWTESIKWSALCKGFADARVSKEEDERVSIVVSILILFWQVKGGFEYSDTFFPRNERVLVWGFNTQAVAAAETETTDAATLLSMFS